jgi:dihydrolipoamide dehydrogenase
VIATGSEVAPLRGIEIDEKVVVSSTGALDLESVPAKLLIVGAGVIGLELGSVWRRLGAEVTVVEFLDRILPGMDDEVAKQFQRILGKQGFTFRLASKVTNVDTSGGNGAKVTVEPAQGEGAPEVLEADIVLVSTGRVPYTDGLGLEDVGIQRDAKGRVEVDAHFSTNIKGVLRDRRRDLRADACAQGRGRGHGGGRDHRRQGGPRELRGDPSVVYTSPEIASVGKTEAELKAEGVGYNVGKFPFTANGRAKVNGTTTAL